MNSSLTRSPNRIAQLPDVIIRLITQSFCGDASAVALAHTQQLTFRLLKDSYRVRGEVEYVWSENAGEEEDRTDSRQSNEFPPSKQDTGAVTSLPRTTVTISVVFPDLRPMLAIDPERPREGQIDPRSYILPKYSLRTCTEDGTDTSSTSLSNDQPAAGCPPHRIGRPNSIFIRTPRMFPVCDYRGRFDKTNNECAKASELTKVLLESLPPTIGSLRIEYCDISGLESLTRLIRLHTLNLEGIHSLESLDVITQSLPQLRVLRLVHVGKVTAADDIILLPPALEELYVGIQDIEKRLVIHENLRVLHHHRHTMSVLEWKLPSTLTELRLGDTFNGSIDGWTPPSSLRTLIFGEYFNRDISKVIWPAGLTRLIMNRYFRQSLVNVVLPDSLLHLAVSSNEQRMSSAALAESRYGTPFQIPPRLESFVITTLYHLIQPNIDWPHSITNLQIDAKYMIEYEDFPLPPRLRILDISGTNKKSLRKFNAPATLESLVMPIDVLCSMELLDSLLQSCADSLRTLKLGRIPHESLVKFHLPPRLTHLSLPTQWNRPVNELPHFPSSLTYLKFGSEWNQPLSAGLQLPSSLRHLHFGSLFTQDVRPLNSILPPHLCELVFRCRRHRELLLQTLPDLILPQYCRLVAVFNNKKVKVKV